MAEVTIRLVYDAKTGKKDVWIDYESDDDALPIEHERDHRAIVEALIGKGVLQAAEVGRVRGEPEGRRASEPTADRSRRGLEEGGG